MDEEYKELINLGKYLVKYRYAYGSSGNISIRLSNGMILASPTNSQLGLLKEDELSLLTEDGELVGGRKPTKEINLHLAIYKKRKEFNSVIHLHSTNLTALSCLKSLDWNNVIKAATPYVVMKVGELPLIPYYRPGSNKIAEVVEKKADQYSAFLLSNHGVVVCGRTIDEACCNFEEIEESAKLFFLLKNMDVNYLSPQNIEELKFQTNKEKVK